MWGHKDENYETRWVSKMGLKYLSSDVYFFITLQNSVPIRMDSNGHVVKWSVDRLSRHIRKWAHKHIHSPWPNAIEAIGFHLKISTEDKIWGFHVNSIKLSCINWNMWVVGLPKMSDLRVAFTSAHPVFVEQFSRACPFGPFETGSRKSCSSRVISWEEPCTEWKVEQSKLHNLTDQSS